jgi:hypothetical protein
VARQNLFSDESGTFAFSRGPNISRYFAVGTLRIDQSELDRLRYLMPQLRDALAWRNQGLDSYFHATNDHPAVRAAVFDLLTRVDFRFDVTLLDKPKARPQLRDETELFKYAWRHHLSGLAQEVVQPDDELMLTAAELGTRGRRKAFRTAIEDVMTDCLPYRVKRVLAFWPSSSDFALQATDYCLWAIQRKAERGDDSHYSIIKDKVHTERDLWERSTKLYY